MSATFRVVGEREGMNFKRRGYAPSAPTTGELLHARTMAARRAIGPQTELVDALRAIVARGLGRTISRIRANAAARDGSTLQAAHNRE